MNNLLAEYNQLIKIENEIGLWLDDVNVPIELKEPHIPKFVELTKKLSKLLNQMTEEGLHYTDDEALFGFKE
jgi:hypothetical protein